MADKLKEISEKDFKSLIAGDFAVVGFWAPWCHACHPAMVLLSELEKDYKKVVFGKMNVAKNPGISSKYGIMSLPNILFFKKGKVAEQIIGSTSKKAIEEKIKKIVK